MSATMKDGKKGSVIYTESEQNKEKENGSTSRTSKAIASEAFL